MLVFSRKVEDYKNEPNWASAFDLLFHSSAEDHLDYVEDHVDEISCANLRSMARNELKRVRFILHKLADVTQSLNKPGRERKLAMLEALTKQPEPSSKKRSRIDNID